MASIRVLFSLLLLYQDDLRALGSFIFFLTTSEHLTGRGVRPNGQIREDPEPKLCEKRKRRRSSFYLLAAKQMNEQRAALFS
jgi:hypothetical protein